MINDVGIIGGGAAGIFCAIQLVENSKMNITILEKSDELLKKVKISGGGRCNVTHQFLSPAQFSKNYPRGGTILKKNFEQFSPADMCSWLKSNGVALKTEDDGRMFPISDDSQTIIDAFLEAINRPQVKINMRSEVISIERAEGHWQVKTNQAAFHFSHLIVATGGPQKERELDFLNQISIQKISSVPSLFTFKIQDKALTSLMGLSVPTARIKILGSNYIEVGPVLITHWGISGPAVLKLSAWGAILLHEKNYEFTIHISWLGDLNDDEVTSILQEIASNHPSGLVSNYRPIELPQRLWLYFLEKSEISEAKKWAELSKKEKNRLIHILAQSSYDIKGKTTYKEEFVTAGGVDTSELDSHTRMHKAYLNLYFIGEITNIDGITGGFNFQNAWTSATIAAKSIARL